MASVTAFGSINIWDIRVNENWSAFAPGDACFYSTKKKGIINFLHLDFTELEENIEYEEREDEFDDVSATFILALYSVINHYQIFIKKKIPDNNSISIKKEFEDEYIDIEYNHADTVDDDD